MVFALTELWRHTAYNRSAAVLSWFILTYYHHYWEWPAWGFDAHLLMNVQWMVGWKSWRGGLLIGERNFSMKYSIKILYLNKISR